MRRPFRMAGLVSTAFMLTTIGTARAEEPKGCDGFKWPVKQDAALLQASTKPILPSGSSATLNEKAFELNLLDFGAAGLPKPPERNPKMSPSKAGYVRFAAPKTAGPYQITISDAAWIDLVQDDHYIKPSAFSGAVDCPGVRKTIRANLAASPFMLQISGTPNTSADIIITPVPQ